MATELLYYEDPLVTEFTATVQSTRASRDKKAGRAEIILDRTEFYPEGGGQPCDVGTLAGFPVVNVQKEDGTVVHTVALEGTSRLPEVGVTIEGCVDRAHRFEYMQQHTGQHILSAALLEVGSYNTVSVHQGDEYTTIEIDRDQLAAGDIERVELLANAIIREDRPISDHWVTDEELGRYPLRRPPKVSGSIRLVMIKDFDCVACGGVHFRRTGAVGLVKCTGVERIRGQVRTAWKIGDRALADYQLKHDVTAALNSALSTKTAELTDRISGLQTQLLEARRRASELQGRLATRIADSLISDASGDAVTGTLSHEDPELFRSVVERLANAASAFFCVVNVVDGRLLWAAGGSNGVPFPFEHFRADALPKIEGKGGGKPPIWQGVGSKHDELQQFFTAFRGVVASTAAKQP